MTDQEKAAEKEQEDVAGCRDQLAGLASDPTLPFAMQQIVAALAEYPYEPGGEDWTAIALDRLTQ